jgi:uncharacterized protein YhjY with autotransporter beta-barrel domain
MGLLATLTARVFGCGAGPRRGLSRWAAFTALVFGFCLLAPAMAAAGSCNLSLTVAENSGATKHILTGDQNTGETHLCDASFNGILTNSGTTAQGGTYSYTAEANDDEYTYTPPAGFHGTDTFPIDGDSVADSGTVTITVLPPNISITPTSLTGGTVGSVYSSTLSGFGGQSPYSFVITSGGLPAGLSLSSAGAITGTPTAGGTFNFMIKATDSSLPTGTTTTQAYSLVISAPTISVSPTTLTSIQQGATASQTITASGGTAPYTFAVTSGALPAGVSLGTNGALAGSPSASGPFSFTVTATDSSTGTGPYTGARAYGWSITPGPPTVTGVSPSSGGSGGGDTITVTGTNLTGATAVHFGGTIGTSVSVGSDTQLTVTSPAHTAGTVDITVTTPPGTSPTTAADHFTYNAIVLAPSTLPAATVAAAYSQTITASGGAGGYSFAVTSGALPAGLTLAAGGGLTGTPTAGGSFNFTITTTDSASATGSLAYTLTVNAPTVTVSPTTVTAATVGQAYSGATFSGSGGTGPYTFSVSAGALPAGMSLNSSTGALSGTPTAGGTFNFTVKALDSSTGTGPYFGTQAVSLTVGAPTITVSPNFPPNMTVGQAYTQTFTASGGTSTYSFAVTAGTIPAGMTLSSGGVLSGTPTEGGTFNFTITATDSSTGTGPFTGSHPYTLLAQAATVTVNPATLPGGTVGAAYSQTLTGSGGTAPYGGFTVTGGALPAGVSLNSSTGALTGTPTAAGTFSVTIATTDSSTGTGPFTGSRGYSLTIAGPTVAIGPGTLTAPVVGQAYSQSVSGSGGTAPYSYAVTSGALPTGLGLNASTGAITGTPTAGGSFSFTITTTDSSTGTGAPFTASQAYSVTVGAPTVTVNPSTLTGATAGQSYSQAFTGSGGTAPYFNFTVSAGALPAGLALSPTGILAGTPTAAGSFSFTIQTTDSSTGTGPFNGSRAYSLTVAGPNIVVGPSTIPGGTVGSGYSQFITASGGTGPYTYSISTGALPPGFTLNTNTGLTGGTPTAGGTFTFGVKAVDSTTGTGAPFSHVAGYSLVIAAPTITVSPTTLTTLTQTVATNQTISASGGTGPFTFAVTGGTLPAGLNLSTAGALTGAPTGTGAYSFTVTATDSSTGTGPYTGSRTYSGTISAGVPVTAAKSATVTYDTATPIDLTASITGGAANSVTVTSGPSHGSTSVSGLTVTYTPTTGYAGPDSFTYTATGPGGTSTPPATVSITVSSPTVSLSPTTLPTPQVGAAYSQTLTGTGGQAPYSSFTVTAGTLPAGLSLNSATGALTGTPTAAGSFSFTVSTTDSSTGTGAPFTGSRAYSGTVTAATVVIAPSTLTGATVGAAYNQSVSASGGTAPYAYSVSAGALPAGLSLNASTGAITGTPTAGGTFNVTIKAIDSSTGTGAPFNGTQAYSLVVSAPTIAVAPTSLAAITQGVATSQTISASGGTGPYTFAVTGGTLPANLNLSSTGALTGTAAGSGPYSFTVTATDSSTGTGPFTGTRTYSGSIAAGVPVAAAKTVTTAYNTADPIDLTSSITVVTASSVTVAGAASHGTTSVSGLVVTFTPTTGYAGPDSFTYTATGPGGPSNVATVSITVGAPTVALTPTTLPNPTVGTAYSQVIGGTGGQAPFKAFTVSAGALPGGLTLNPTTGALTGTPNAGGPFSFTISATDSSTGTGPFPASQAYSVTVNAPTVTITPTSVPDATVAAAYSQPLSVTGGTAPYGFTVSAGALPAGITLNPTTGALTGTPTAGGRFSFTIKVTDSSTGAGAPYSGAQAYTMAVSGPTITVGPASLAQLTQGAATSQTFTATGGVAPYVFTVTGTLPAGLSVSTTGALTGAPTGTGSFNFTVTATDSATGSGPFHGGHTYTGNIVPSAPIAGADSVTVPYGAATAIPLTSVIAGGPATSVAVTTAPGHGTTKTSGLTVTYTPAAGYSGADSFAYTATGVGGTSAPATVSVTVSAPALAIAPATLSAPVVGARYSQTLSGSGGLAPYAFSVTVGTLPTGLTLSSAGAITGTPTAGGPFTFTVKMTDSSTGAGSPFSVSTPFSVTVTAPAIHITPTTLSAGTYGVAYPHAALAASGGSAPYTFAVTSGVLPTGITVSNAGVLGGTPTQAGTFNFAVTATDSSTGAGPYSGAQALSLVIAAPAPPTAAAKSVTVPFNSPPLAIDLSGSVSGAATSVTVATNPAHGTATASGETVTYTPTAGYFGADSFTYAAVGPGGNSAPATVSITIPTPTPTAVADTATTNANQAVTIAVTANDTGPIASIAVTAQPGHGTAVVSGLNVVYTPAANFFGQDTFAYAATGAGGTSAPATVKVTVAALAVPVAPALTGSVVAGQSVTLHPTVGATGSPFTAVAVVTQPAQGTATINGLDIVYTAPANGTGSASFTYTLANAFGVSAAATATVTINPAPGPKAISQSIDASAQTSVNLTDGATGGPFVSAAVVGQTPTNGGTAKIVVSGGDGPAQTSTSGGGKTFSLVFTPAPDFVGPVVVSYTLSNAFGTSAPATVTFQVNRPDPTKDPHITGLVTAENEAVREFAQAQISNFGRRLEDLHAPDGGKSSFGVSFNFGDYGRQGNSLNDPEVRRMYEQQGVDPMTFAVMNASSGFDGSNFGGAYSGGLGGGSGGGLGTTSGGVRGGGLGVGSGSGSGQGGGAGAPGTLPGGMAIWATGSVDLGQRNNQIGEDRLKFTTTGVSFGLDAPVGSNLIVGAGGGFGANTNVIANAQGQDDGTKLSGRNYVGALYASWEPVDKFFIDGLVGVGRLSFDTRRLTVASTLVEGSRTGNETFGSLTAAWEYREGALHVSPYGRIEAASANLGAYSETGDPVLSLRFASQNVDLLTGDLGIHGDYVFHFSSGDFLPKLRIEYRHEFDGAGSATFNYASVIGGQAFTVQSLPLDHDTIDLGVGAEWRLKNGFHFSLDYEGSLANKQEDQQRVLVKVSKQF